MGLIDGVLTFPVLGAPRLVVWLAGKLAEEYQRELLDEGRVRGELLELQERYEAGELGEAAYDRGERALLERLSFIREAKLQQSQRG